MITYGLGKIATYIGGPATVFIATLLIVIMLRIGVAFLFKLFRLNIDYHTLQSKSKTWSQRDSLEGYSDKSLFD